MPDKKVKYCLNPAGEFVIENYNHSRPFANFFPGIAGKYGIPMWVFYVNRGQCVCSFGIKDKDHAILEFFPANKAWQLVSTYGFRTFIKVAPKGKVTLYEPFQDGAANTGFQLSNKMLISSYELALREENKTLGINTAIEYFNIPNDKFSGLSRNVTIKNTSRSKIKIDYLDGLPQVVPFGTNNFFLKNMGRTIEAWMEVENLNNSVSFYKLSVDPNDKPDVTHIKSGNFYLGFHYVNEKKALLKPIVNPGNIFDDITDFSFPKEFLKANFKAPKNELIKSKMPCGMLSLSFELKPDEEKIFYSVIGNCRDIKLLNSLAGRISCREYLEKKRSESKSLIGDLQKDIATSSGSREFDLYAKQTYLDNILRGGYPVKFDSGAVFYLYSRKHGDLERDYNNFQIQPSYFSQGNGNYRDMNQNRRSGIWFNPETIEESLIYFLSLIQTDGFNPLILKGSNYLLKDEPTLQNALSGIIPDESITKVTELVKKTFTPGDLAAFLEENRICAKNSYDAVIGKIISCSSAIHDAEHGEGFWTDHWHYNLDLIESYLGVYPEKLGEIFFEKKVFTFFDNAEIVKPRKDKYALYEGSPKQLNAVAVDQGKKELIKKRRSYPHLSRAKHGEGEIYSTTLVNKLLCILANKLASLDPFGCGIEMEANKPNWFDALNGLPALFGSSVCETFELKRLILILKRSFQAANIENVSLTEEVGELLLSLNFLIEECSSHNKECAFFWDKSHVLKEDYWQRTKFGFSGNETDTSIEDLNKILDNALKKVDEAIEKAFDKNSGMYYSYFYHQATEYDLNKENHIFPKMFSRKTIPLFLEGQMHALRLAKDATEARSLYNATKKSALFDRKLKMYKVTAPLGKMPEEIGRCRVFTPGWLENESIWLHMEYKYLLEILKQGLCEEFFQEFKNTLVCFQKPERYGRSILENSSFIVSSAFPDKSLIGNGYVARLSGSTAEFLEIWLKMNSGNSPFLLDENGQLQLRFEPKLAGWLFDRKGDYSFNFLSKTEVTYHNPKKKDTFGKSAAKIKRVSFVDKSGNPVEINSDTIPSPYAEQIRLRLVNKIDIYLE